MKQISFPKSFSYPASQRVPSRILTTEIGQPFLYFMFSRSFTPLWMTKKRAKQKKETSHPNERSDVAKKHKGPASLFCREAEVLFGALKTKSCLSVSEFFLFSAEKCRSRQKSADGEFSLFRFFCSCKRNEKPSRLEREQSDKPLRRLSNSEALSPAATEREAIAVIERKPTFPH